MNSVRCTVIMLTALTTSCNQTKFRATGKVNEERKGEEAPPTPDPDPPKKVDPPPSDPPACDMSKEFVKINFPGKVQSCIEGGFIYDFYRDTCSPVPKASTYTCDFAGLKNRVASMKVDGSAIDTAIANNAKLVGCGEKRGGLTVVTEWWYPDSQGLKTDCAFYPGMKITVACFQVENGDGTIVDPSTEEEKKEMLRKCLQ